MQFIFIPMRNCKIFLLGVTSQEGTPMVPPQPLRVGLGLPSSALFLPGFPVLRSLGTIRQIFCKDCTCSQILGRNGIGHGCLQGPRAELHHRRAGTWHKGKGLPGHLGRQKWKRCQQALAVNWGMAQQAWKGDVTRGEEGKGSKRWKNNMYQNV